MSLQLTLLNIILFYSTLVAPVKVARQLQQPNIIFILADDLGWNDVGFHGSNQIPTPNIDALAYTGLILNNYYVTPICTPSRAAIMTAKYPIHTGLNHGVIGAAEPYGLDLNETILPQHLQRRGYATHAVGKWHLGSFKKEYTPIYRGFDSHFGYWTGHQDYYDHTAQDNGYWGLDMRKGMEINRNAFGEYSTDLFKNEAVKVIESHNTSRPLFLYLAHLAVHSANGYQPLQAPAEVIKKFSYIQDEKRRIYAAMVSKLDDSVGAVVEALKRKNMLENTIIIFSTDNGGPAAGFNANAASNWPLRGVKNSLWEGGVRGSALIWYPIIPQGVSNHLMHLVDWVPTLLTAIGDPLPSDKDATIDGKSMWEAFITGDSSPRKDVLLNIDNSRKIGAYRYGDWKLLKGKSNVDKWADWFGPSGRDRNYAWRSLFDSPAAKALKSITPLPPIFNIQLTRGLTQLDCPVRKVTPGPADETFLYNLAEDPCETKNLANVRKDKVKQLERGLQRYNKSMIPPKNLPRDPRANPIYWNYTWTNWMDFVN